jgi:autotransporter translocation and assembly factor TamB
VRSRHRSEKRWLILALVALVVVVVLFIAFFGSGVALRFFSLRAGVGH